MSTEKAKIKTPTLLFIPNSAQKDIPLKAFNKDLKTPTASHSSSDEEDCLSYKKQINLEFNQNYKNPRKKSGNTYDFKTKWKTEICHFWEMNGYCQFGENVYLKFLFYFSALLPMDQKI